MLRGEVTLPDYVERLDDADMDGDVAKSKLSSKAAKAQKKDTSKTKVKAVPSSTKCDDNKLLKEKHQPAASKARNFAAPIALGEGPMVAPSTQNDETVAPQTAHGVSLVSWEAPMTVPSSQSDEETQNLRVPPAFCGEDFVAASPQSDHMCITDDRTKSVKTPHPSRVTSHLASPLAGGSPLPWAKRGRLESYSTSDQPAKRARVDLNPAEANSIGAPASGHHDPTPSDGNCSPFWRSPSPSGDQRPTGTSRRQGPKPPTINATAHDSSDESDTINFSSTFKSLKQTSRSAQAGRQKSSRMTSSPTRTP